MYISHYWHMPLNKYSFHIIYVCPTALILQSTCRPHINVHTNLQKNPPTFNYQVITIYLPTTYMPLKYQYTPHMPISSCADIKQLCLTIYSAINNVTRSTTIHVSHYSHMSPKKISLTHCTYMSHCTSTVVYILTPHYCTHPSKINKCNIYFP